LENDLAQNHKRQGYKVFIFQFDVRLYSHNDPCIWGYTP